MELLISKHLAHTDGFLDNFFLRKREVPYVVFVDEHDDGSGPPALQESLQDAVVVAVLRFAVDHLRHADADARLGRQLNERLDTLQPDQKLSWVTLWSSRGPSSQTPPALNYANSRAAQRSRRRLLFSIKNDLNSLLNLV